MDFILLSLSSNWFCFGLIFKLTTNREQFETTNKQKCDFPETKKFMLQKDDLEDDLTYSNWI